MLFRPTYALLAASKLTAAISNNNSHNNKNNNNGRNNNSNNNWDRRSNSNNNNNMDDINMKKSSIHVVTTPLLTLLHRSENSSLIGRINEGLQRVALGLSRNETVLATELLLYIHSTLQPFVLKIIKDNLHRKHAIGKFVFPSYY